MLQGCWRLEAVEQAEGESGLAGGRVFILFLACMVVFLDSVTYGVVVPVVPVFSREMGIGEFRLGVLFASYAATSLAAAIPMGMLTDRWGRKPFILFGMFGTAVACLMYAFASGFTGLLLARMLDGLTAAATWSAGFALVGDRFEESEMGLKMGYVVAAAALGGIGGPLLGGILSEAAGYAAPFHGMALACAAGGIVALLLREKGFRHRAVIGSAREMLRPVIRNRPLMLACLITMTVTVGLGLLEPTLPVYLSESFGMSYAEIGVLFGLTMSTYALASPPAGRLSDRIGRKGPIVTGLIVTALAAPLLSLLGSRPMLYVVMGLLGATLALVQTPSMSLVTENMEKRGGDAPSLYGTAFGLMNLSWSLGYAVGPLLGGAVMGWVGLTAALLSYSAILVGLTVVVAFALRGETPARNRPGCSP